MGIFFDKLRSFGPNGGFYAHQVGAAYAHGERVRKDLGASRRWYGLGARRGHSECRYDLGFMLLLGEGGPVDVARGLELLRAAADGDSDDAAKLLADVYRAGHYGVARDPDLSAHYARRYDELRG